MGDTLERVPAHLRRFVVQQDYAAYTAVDQAVWRFVLLQMFDRLASSAHPAYARGLAQTGMSVDRIPRIAEMDRCLGEFGWGAVCVDGFIPPRAFQEFQALGLLPIAADMRRLEHLAYTPAPDIIHEAAGHAPILPDREYAAFLRRIGGYGVRAFASSRDGALYEAIRELSIVKEQRRSDPGRVADAEHALADLVARPEPASEAARLARLYWWTVEYGLVGTIADYKLYGAGLLSSLAESHFCHDAAVRKRVLSRDCAVCDYDITQPQPQLFVARDFAHLSVVLEEICADFAFQVGGLAGLRTAQAAAELATVELDSGVQVTGTVSDVLVASDQPCLFTMLGECAIGEQGRIFAGHHRAAYPRGLTVAFGQLAGEGGAAGLSLQAPRAVEVGAELELELGSGLRITGRLQDLVQAPGRSARAIVLRGARAQRGDRPIDGIEGRPLAIVAGERMRSVRAGVEDPSYWPSETYQVNTAPRRSAESESRRALRLLYEQEATSRAQACPVPLLASIYDELKAKHGNEWLLRWNLLERLSRLNAEPARRTDLAKELARLELHFDRKHPIATGLKYLGHAEYLA